MAGPAPMSPPVSAEFHHDAVDGVRTWVAATVTQLARGPLAIAGTLGELVEGIVAGLAGEGGAAPQERGPVKVAVSMSDDLVEVRIQHPDTERSDLLLIRR